ncbi:MAG TPA: DUF1634 domain-containing protein [Acidimicrobiia bacterium]
MSLDRPLVSARRYERSEGEQRSRQQETRQLEARIAAILRTGVVTAAVLLTVALPWMVFQDASHRAHRLSVGEGLRLLPGLDPRALAAVGVIILVATPILQLLMSAFLFWRKRDRLYLALSLTVCVIIAVGALLTGGGH